MSSAKTVPTRTNPIDFLATLDSDEQRRDSEALIKMMHDISGKPPVMWGTSIIGFGQFTYTYSSGQTGIWPPIAFAPRKGMLSLYVTVDAGKFEKELEAVGRHKIGKGCIYIKRLADVDTVALKTLIHKAYEEGFFGDQA